MRFQGCMLYGLMLFSPQFKSKGRYQRSGNSLPVMALQLHGEKNLVRHLLEGSFGGGGGSWKNTIRIYQDLVFFQFLSHQTSVTMQSGYPDQPGVGVLWAWCFFAAVNWFRDGSRRRTLPEAAWSLRCRKLTLFHGAFEFFGGLVGCCFGGPWVAWLCGWLDGWLVGMRANTLCRWKWALQSNLPKTQKPYR